MNDQELHSLVFIKKIKECDEEAFKSFFVKYFPEVYRFIFRMIGDNDISKDLTQDTFLNFYRSLDKLQLNIPPNFYLFRIAKNLSINFLTRDYYSINKIEVDEQEETNNHGITFNIEDELNLITLEDEINKAIESLPNRCRAIFILSRFHDMSYQEIADSLGISINTVKNQINKALAILKRRLSKYLE